MNYTNRAGLGVRVLASFLDFIILATIIGVVVYLLTGSFSLNFANGVAWQSIYTLYLMVIPIIWSGYVIGKHLCSFE